MPSIDDMFLSLSLALMLSYPLHVFIASANRPCVTHVCLLLTIFDRTYSKRVYSTRISKLLNEIISDISAICRGGTIIDSKSIKFSV